jgi:hypothetical protein
VHVPGGEGACVDLDDLLEDLWEDVVGDARKKASRANAELRRKARLPSLRRRLRGVALWGSTAWVTIFGAGAVATELAIDGGVGTALAVVLGGIALPAVGTGVWAWRTRDRDLAVRREAEAARRARQEQDDLPADVVGEWKRLRRAQVLVEDLAEQGLVDIGAIDEQTAMVDQLRQLLVADKRAAELGAEPSARLRRQVGDLADLLVALAQEAVDSRSEEVGRSSTPATIRDARDRLTSLRAARAEVDRVDDDAARASEFIEQARRDRSANPPVQQQRRPRRDDDQGGTRRATPG